MAKKKKDDSLKVIVLNPPTKEHIQIKLKELSAFLSREMSKSK